MAQNYSKVGWQDHVKDETTGVVLRQGTPVSASNLNKMDAGIELAHQKLEGANRQVQSLTHGIQVLNGDVNAPVSIQMDGRTLISLQNTELDASKYYILADKRTKLKFSDSLIVQGINKFQGVNAKQQIITRIANYENKSAGSNTDNPHIAKSNNGTVSGWNVLASPSSFQSEFSAAYSTVGKLDGVFTQLIQTVSGNIAQGLFSFNVVEEVERNVGRIPRNTFSEKVQWIKENVAKIICNFYGYGKGPSGYKVSLQRWTSGAWTDSTSSVLTSGSVSKVAQGASDSPSVNTLVQSDGFVHFLAFTEAADATSQSQVNIDYVELEIELKSTAVLHAPRIPLYEVTKEQYDAALVTWNEAEIVRRYPVVESVQHIQNPFFIAEGDNLLIPFPEWGYHVSLKPTFDDPYTVTVESTGSYQVFATSVPCFPNTKYGFFMEVNQAISGNGSREIRVYDANGNSLAVYYSDNIEFTTPANASYITVRLGSGSNTGISVNKFSKPILSIGSVKPFVPRNPSYLYTEAKLGAIGTAKDILFEQDGKMLLRKAIEKDVLLDGSQSWSVNSDKAGYKIMQLSGNPFPNPDVSKHLITKYDGKIIKFGADTYGADYYSANTSGYLWISVANAESGFTETYRPVPEEVKAYFNGWKVKTVDANNKPTAWTSIVDGTDAPTQTLAYVSANKATGYIPYKISYVMATPVVSEVKSEGSITVNGNTQIELGSGIVIREKATPTPVSSGTFYTINQESTVASLLKNKVGKFIALYKNSIPETIFPISVANSGWYRENTYANGAERLTIRKELFDTTAEYYVTYIVMSRTQFTTNPLVATGTFANNIRTALEDNIKATEDNKREISVATLQIYEILKRIKAGGL